MSAADIATTPLAPAPDATPARARRDESILRSLWHDKAALAGAIYLRSSSSWRCSRRSWYRTPPTAVDIFNRVEPPVWDGGTWEYLLGTDPLGRDMLSRLVYGARLSLLIGVSVVLISGTVGTLLGIVAGYKGGRWDAMIMRVADAQLAFPGLLLVLLVLAFIGPSIPGDHRRRRDLRLDDLRAARARHGPAAARARPRSRPRSCSARRRRASSFKHMLPMLYSALLTQGMLELARVILVEASLSYLGLGVQPPTRRGA